MTHHIDHDVENDRHRASCAECQALWAELEAISADAARLPTLTPSRDLWSGIEARIATTPRALPFHRTQAFRLAVAASLLVAVSSAVTWQLASRAPATLPAATVAVTDGTPEGAVDADDAAIHLAAFSASVTQMDREIAALQTIISERRDELDPATIAVLERNLSVIDAAIAESRDALAADPASQFLAQQFTRAYTSKLTLLRGAVQLPAGL